jgi:hypothetical protein
MTTEVPNTDETGTITPNNNHADGDTSGVLAAELTDTAETPIKPDNNHADSEPA